MATVDEIIAKVRSENRKILTEFESKELLQTIGISIPKQALVLASNGADEVIKTCDAIGYPLVMKLMSDKIVHKSDSGAVKLGIKDAAEARIAYDGLMAIECVDETKAISVQEMAPKPIAEIIIGSLQDPQFGATVMFGIGGVLVEVMKDVSFRIAPISDFDADEMLHEIKGFKILDGYRGNDKADFEAIKDTLKKVAQLAYDYPEIAEMDLNPLFTYKDGIVAVDGRIILKDE
ncbi:Acetate--CoA ligase [ADP-forming] I subunit beta [Candidatus Lokiarchaeum ossiferum]|uniref:Acetate--CoA ligase [ADP-forming] I subunit beta n=1 Tax=Candidatus Lokiarchaeum ossiferum TaxID=2951803 RepID=A0ABY6HPF0_9ARCH|nr:Acetate--CoA ligase [ADP-forming] I subunit beta [Candidatus Lokiarchaeum sp. B-35]